MNNLTPHTHQTITIVTNTTKTYKGVMKRYAKTTLANDPILTRESIVLHLQTLREADYSPSTINYDLERLSAEYLSKSDGDYEQRKHDLKKIKQLFHTKNLAADYSIKSIELDEIQKLIDQTPERLSLIIELLSYTGLRISEALNLKHTDKDAISSNRDHIYFEVIGKGRKKRSTFISMELYARIVSCFNGKTYLFETIQGKPYRSTYITREISRLSGKIIGKNIHSHTLRHSWFTHEIRNGVPIDAVSRGGGHYSPAFTLSKYSHNQYTPELSKIKFKGKTT